MLSWIMCFCSVGGQRGGRGTGGTPMGRWLCASPMGPCGMSSFHQDWGQWGSNCSAHHGLCLAPSKCFAAKIFGRLCSANFEWLLLAPSPVAIPEGLSLGSAGGTFEGTWLTCLGIANVLFHTQNTLQAQSRIALASLQRLSHPAPSHLFCGGINSCYCTGLFSLSSNGISKKEQRKANQR